MNRILIWLLALSAYSLQGQSTFSLQEAVDYAIEHSSEVALNELDVKNAEAQIVEIKSAGLPQVNGGIDYNYYFYLPAVPIPDFITPAIYGVLQEQFPNEVTPPAGDPEFLEFAFATKNNLTARVDASMLIFDGSYLVGVKAAKLFRELTKKKKDIKLEEIKASVTKAYMNILIAEENKSTLKKNLETLTSSLKEAQAYYETGFIEQLEVKRINLSKESLETELQKIDQLIDINKNLLKFQMAYPLDQEISLTEDLETLVNTFSADAELIEKDVDFNKKAQYREIEMGEQINELNIERLKKGYLPNVVARAGAAEALQRNKLFDGTEAGWIPSLYAGVAVNIPITDGKRKRGLIQQAEIEQEKISIQKSEYERGIKMQVQTAQLQHKSAKESLFNSRRILEVNQEIYDTTLIKFKEGVGSSIEVTQAESSLKQAQGAYINDLYQLLITKTDLDIALGEL